MNSNIYFDNIIFCCFSHLEKAWVVPVSVFLEVEAIIFVHLLEPLFTLKVLPKAFYIIIKVPVLEVEVFVSP